MNAIADNLEQKETLLPRPDSEGALPDEHKIKVVYVVDARDRIAFTMAETAAMIGVSYITLHRLCARGLIRPSNALRTKIFSRIEIERFLKSSQDISESERKGLEEKTHKKSKKQSYE